MKKEYIKPICYVKESILTNLIAVSYGGNIGGGGCNCRGFDCSCGSRSECTGSGIDGCHEKGGKSMVSPYGSLWDGM